MKSSISRGELAELKRKAQKWDEFCAKQASHLNQIPKEERSTRARKAATTRWANAKTAKKE